MLENPKIQRFGAQVLVPMARAWAMVLAGFCLLNLAGNLLTPQFDANVWWIDLRPLPGFVSAGLLAAGALALGLAGAAPAAAWRLRWPVGLALGALTAAALLDTLEFYILLQRAAIRSARPLPLSLVVAAGLLLVATTLRPQGPAIPVWRSRVFYLTAALTPVAFPLLQMFFFGATDYRRPADAIVVFGARTYADGRPSQALADRVRTACGLYHAGLAPVLIFSGGAGDGPVSEPQAMRAMALSCGVPETAIVLDGVGFNTQATVAHVSDLARARGYRSVLAVSHAYHLPRVKLAFQRAGLEAYTVPAHETRPLVQMPKLMAREIPALWAYYLEPLAG